MFTNSPLEILTISILENSYFLDLDWVKLSEAVYWNQFIEVR